ncbi:hypothetical protein IE53DRAFT_389462 [Violaceomyces palustris]|uniref:Uncharacterized protein n=1 Tax=Violaceomyces palustris TaxID=1673888 RepID=A0ACD0NR84_9BASI|nr:hypothetical protein IE53DRAFT_389462 [Violaceomyces palustris]
MESETLFKRKRTTASNRQVRKRSLSPPPPPPSSSTAPLASPPSAVILKNKRSSMRNTTSNLSYRTNPSFKRSKFSSATSPSLSEEEEEDDPSPKLLDRFGESDVVTRQSSKFKDGLGGGGANLDSSIERNRRDATRTNDWDLEVDDEGNPLPSLPSTSKADETQVKPNNDDGIYRGIKAYSGFTPGASASRNASESGGGGRNKFLQKGPIKPTNTNIRTVTVVDYQPDICKDYKETGYCGFGDTCKFLHDRSDYLAGWQLDQSDFLPNSSSRRRLGGEGEDDEDDEEDEEEQLPFACLLCRKPFQEPVVTRCGHYFCSACAIKRYSRTPKCFACGAQTAGLFNSADKVLKRMERRRKRKEEEREERRRARFDRPVEDRGEILEGVEIGGGFQEEEEE